MDLIQEILNKLSLQEIKRIRSHIKNNPHEYDKVEKLFELINKYPNQEENFYSQKLYKQDAGNSFRVTKARLKRLMEESLLNEKSLKEYDAEYIIAFLATKKRLLQGEILMGRGAYAASKNLLEQVIASAKRFYFMDEWFYARMLLFRHSCNSLTGTELMKEVEELQQLRQFVSKLQEAGILYYRLSGLLASTTLKEEKEFLDARNTIEVLRLIWKETSIPQTGFYYLKTAIYYYQITYDYSEALTYSQELLELVRTAPALQSHQREGAALLQLSEVCLRAGEFKRAETFIKATLQLYKPEEVNFLIALETDFRISFFNGNYARCAEILGEANQHSALSISKLRAARWKYFEAALNFKQAHFIQCIRLLNEATPVMSDKSGWNIALRLLEIMSLFEAGKRDLLESRIENLKQFARRNQQEDDSTRARLLTEIISVWHKNDWNFAQAGSYLRDEMARLEAYHNKVPFNPASFELIRVEEWIDSHTKN
jgi:hypothetical protein